MTQKQQPEPLTRGERIKHLRLALSPLMGRMVAQDSFGQLVAAEQDRQKPYDVSTVSRWEDNSSPPELGAIEAMVRIARTRGLAYVTRAWLAFGDEGVIEARDAPRVPAINRPAFDAKRSKGGIPADPAATTKRREA